MSDIADLKARIAAARQFTVTVGPADAPRTVHLQEPDDYQVKLAGIRSGLRGGKDPAAELLFERTLLVEAITGWSGVEDAEGVAIAPSPEAIDALLEVWPIFAAFEAQYIAVLLVVVTEGND